jgi:hypothetical protein
MNPRRFALLMRALMFAVGVMVKRAPGWVDDFSLKP